MSQPLSIGAGREVNLGIRNSGSKPLHLGSVLVQTRTRYRLAGKLLRLGVQVNQNRAQAVSSRIGH